MYRNLSRIGCLLLTLGAVNCGRSDSDDDSPCEMACEDDDSPSGDGGSCADECSTSGGSGNGLGGEGASGGDVGSGGHDGSGASQAAGGTGSVTASGGTEGATGGSTGKDAGLDETFGVDGAVRTALRDGSDELIDLERLNDGKMIAVATNGAHSDVLVYRFNQDGTPDITFNGVGSAIWELGLEARARGVDVQSDGKILVLAKDTSGTQLVRFGSDGQRDMTWGTSGVYAVGADEAVIAVQADDQVLLATGGTFQTQLRVVRLTADGLWDASYGSVAAGELGETTIPYNIGVDAEGRAVVAYYVSFTNSLGIARVTTQGSLDATLAGTGFFKTELKANPGIFNVHGFAIQEDSKMVLAGQYQSDTRRLARYSEDGSLDETFDADGYVVFPRSTPVVDMSVFGSGNSARLLVLCGGEDSSDDAMLRYRMDGSLDPDFSTDGIVDLSSRRTWSFTADDTGTAVLAIVERSRPPAYSDSYFRARLHQVNPAGVLDAGFAEAHAHATLDEIRALSRAADGGVYAVGKSSQNGGFYPGYAVVRYDSSGSVVESFGEQGFLFLDSTGGFAGQAVVMDSQGRLLVNGGPQSRTVRLSADGVLDESFGNAGFGLPEGAGGSDYSYAVELDATDRVLVGGAGTVSGGRAAFVSRLTANGSADEAFGDDGAYVWPTTGALYGTGVHDLLVQADQKILVTGHGNVGLLTRLTVDGDLDEAFTTTDNTDGLGRDIALSKDGKVVVVGSTAVSGFIDTYESYVSNNQLLVARFLSDGTKDELFADGGLLITDLAGTKVKSPMATAVQVMDDGTIYVAGTGRYQNADHGFILRLFEDGAIDTHFGEEGVLVPPTTGAHSALYDLIHAGERLVAGGYSWGSPTGRDFALVGLIP